MNSFIVRFWSWVFSWLRCISWIYIVRKIFPKTRLSYGFIDAWTVGNTMLALISVWIVQYNLNGLLKSILLVYGISRVFEIIVYQTNILLFDEYRAGDSYVMKSYRRTVILLLHNFAEIIFWFAAFYCILSEDFNCPAGNSISGAIYNSFATMTTFGTAEVNPVTRTGLYILWGQSFAGMFMTLISLARFIGLLPRPRSIDERDS